MPTRYGTFASSWFEGSSNHNGSRPEDPGNPETSWLLDSSDLSSAKTPATHGPREARAATTEGQTLTEGTQIETLRGPHDFTAWITSLEALAHSKGAWDLITGLEPLLSKPTKPRPHSVDPRLEHERSRPGARRKQCPPVEKGSIERSVAMHEYEMDVREWEYQQARLAVAEEMVFGSVHQEILDAVGR